MTTRTVSKQLSSYGRLGVLLTAIGTILAIDVMANVSFLYRLWPILTAILGIGFIGIYARRGRREGAYVGVGVYLIGFSGLALYCSLTTWSRLSALWPMFIGLLGLSIVLGYMFGKRKAGLLLIGLLFISTSAVFFFVFAVSHELWWTVFILTGASLFFFDKARRT